MSDTLLSQMLTCWRNINDRPNRNIIIYPPAFGAACRAKGVEPDAFVKREVLLMYGVVVDETSESRPMPLAHPLDNP